jgi:phosphatidylglycerol:prolipoprotein diacylglycerol transferase
MHPTLISFGPFRLATYGVVVALGYLTGILWLNSRRERIGFDEKTFWGLIYAMFFGAVLGGKVLYWCVEWRALLSGALRPIRDFRYGFVFMGGFMGSALGAWLYRRRHSFSFLKVGDYFGAAMPMGHTIGRLACVFAGCCMGSPTSMPWGVAITDPTSLVDPRYLGVPLHPSPVYESAANALIAALMLARIRKVEAGKAPQGSVLFGYLTLYGLARFALEFFRGDDRGGFLLGLSVSQWICVGWLAAGAWGLLALRRGAPAASAAEGRTA